MTCHMMLGLPRGMHWVRGAHTAQDDRYFARCVLGGAESASRLVHVSPGRSDIGSPLHEGRGVSSASRLSARWSGRTPRVPLLADTRSDHLAEAPLGLPGGEAREARRVRDHRGGISRSPR